MKVLVETFNGQGYSEPTIKQSEDVFKDTLEMMKEYVGFFEIEIAEGTLCFDNGIDQGCIQCLDLPYDGFTLLRVLPDINEVFVDTRFAKLKSAKKYLKEIVNDGAFVEEDEVEEYDENHMYFGGHTDNGFEYWAIVGNHIQECYKCGKEYSEEKEPDFCPHCLTSL